MIIVFTTLYTVSVFLNGWTTTYNVLLAITSPSDPAVRVEAVAWIVSIVGWLAAPAVFGAVAGVVIAKSIDGRRRRSLSDVFTPPGGPDE